MRSDPPTGSSDLFFLHKTGASDNARVRGRGRQLCKPCRRSSRPGRRAPRRGGARAGSCASRGGSRAERPPRRRVLRGDGRRPGDAARLPRAESRRRGAALGGSARSDGPLRRWLDGRRSREGDGGLERRPGIGLGSRSVDGVAERPGDRDGPPEEGRDATGEPEPTRVLGVGGGTGGLGLVASPRRAIRRVGARRRDRARLLPLGEVDGRPAGPGGRPRRPTAARLRGAPRSGGPRRGPADRSVRDRGRAGRRSVRDDPLRLARVAPRAGRARRARRNRRPPQGSGTRSAALAARRTAAGAR